jgi:microsomal dipeptidase-like Zn-dependent dipeptidase
MSDDWALTKPVGSEAPKTDRILSLRVTACVHHRASDLFARLLACNQFVAERSDEMPLWEEYIPQTRVKVVTTVEDVADHIDHAVKIAGIDHVGIGSDFDGIAAAANGPEDVSKMPALIAVLLKRGYMERDLKKILGEKFHRALVDECHVPQIQY